MKDSRKTKEQLLGELAAARARVEELEAFEADAKGAEAELRRHISTLKALNEISKAINEALTLEDLLESATRLLADNAHVVAGGIYLAGADARSLHLEKSFGRKPHFYDRREMLAADDPHVQSIFKSPGAVFADGLLGDEDWRGAIREDLRDEGHVVAAAMRSAGEILGLFSMVLEKADVYTMSFVEMMASDLASGVRRKLAEEELVKHRQRLELLVGERADELRAANEQLQREVAERKRAEEVLRESEDKYHAIVDWAPFGVVIYREDEILFVNSAAREILKYGPDEELRGRSVFDLVAPEDREKAAKVMRDVKSGAGPSRFELGMLCRDGVVKLAEAAGLIFNYGGEPAFMATLVDVTERKRAEEALHESEERYRQLVETSPDAIVQTDLEGNIVALNQKTASLYGVEDVEGLVGRSAFEFIRPEQRERAYKSLREVLETGSGIGIEYDLSREDGTYYHADVNVSLVRGADGEPRGFIAVIRDATARKRAETALRESEERFRKLAENLRDPVMIYDAEREQLIYGNAAAVEMLGIGVHDISALKFQDLLGRFVYEEDRDYLIEANTKAAVARSAGSVEIVDLEFRVRRADGEIRWVRQRSYPVPTEEAAVSKTHVIWSDITERKRVEETLRESAEKYHAIAECAPFGVYIHRDGEILYVNDAARELFRYGPEDELVGRSIFEFIHPDDRETVLKVMEERKRDGSFLPYEVRALCKDGEVRTVETAGRLFDYAGESAYIGTVNDVTERTRAEEEVRESETRYRTLQANIPVGVYRSSAELGGRLLSANPALARMFGYERPEDMYETPVAELYADPDERKGFIAAVSSAGAVSNYETQFRKKDGTEFWGSLSARAVKRPDGEVAYFDGILEDITGRKEAEKAVAESEEKYRTLVEQATDGVVIVQDGRIRFANKAAAKLGSYDNTEELIGEEIGPFIAPQFRELVSETYQRVIAGETAPGIFEIAILDRKGKKVPVEVNAGITYYEGHPAAIVIARDVAERRRAEKRIRYFSEFTKNIIESTQVGIYALDKKGTVLIWNQGMVSQFGVEAEELVGRNIFETFPALNEEPLGAAIKGALSRGEPFEQTGLRHRTRKKGERIINTKVNTLKDASGAIVGAVVITEDVTERQRAEDKIKYFSEFTQNIIESTQVGMYALGKKGTVLIWNQGMVSQFGVGAEELVGRNIFEAFPALEDEPLGAAIKAALSRGESFERAGLRHRTLKKGERVINTKINPLSDAAGRLMGAVVITEDVTERVQAEEKLRASEERFRTLTANIPVGAFRTTTEPAGRLLSANPALAKMFGYDRPEAMYEVPVVDLYLNPHERKDFIRAVESSGPISDYEVRLKRKDGTAFWGSLSARVIADEAGRAAFIDGILEDVTERKRNEEALRESEEKYRTLVEQATDGVAIVQDGVFKFVNEALAQLAGYDSPRDLAAKEFVPFVAPEFRELTVEKHRSTMAGEGAADIFEIALLRRDGGEVPIEVTSGIIQYEGRPAAIVTIRDITDRELVLDKVRKSLNGTIYAMSKMVETRDPYTSGHQLRVAKLARALAREMDLSPAQVEGIYMAAAVHDIGKIAIPEGILSKPGRLTDLELNIIKNHPQVGFDILKNVEFAWPITDVVLQHHERLDGSGYPQGLSGDEISFEARILSVADVVEAMSSHRPYRPTLGVDKALEEISAYKGVLYDSRTVEACLKLFREKDFKFN
jgi:PAS domain S-box-containing protein/putative nucleotidyltransferase with HDIG domain